MPVNPFVSLFGRSPIGPMQQHMAKSHECAANLVPLFQAVMAEDWEKVEQIQQQMSQLENEADKLKKSVRQHLPKSLFLPVPRSDLLDLLSVQDKIANRAKDIAGLMLGRCMTIPQALQPQMLAYVQRTVDASAQALKALKELDSLLKPASAAAKPPSSKRWSKSSRKSSGKPTACRSRFAVRCSIWKRICQQST